MQGSILDLKFGGEAIRFKAEIGQYTRGRGVHVPPSHVTQKLRRS